jgi:hypothetical protein
MLPVLPDSAREIVDHANIESAVRPVRDDLAPTIQS